MSVYQKLLEIKRNFGAGYLVLIDPDKTLPENLPQILEKGIKAGVDAFLVGGSLLLTPDFDLYIRNFKKYSQNKPVIIFPGGIHQISKHADAILFLSLLSGRNADHLIGTQVLASPIIHRLQLEAISTAYLLIESGEVTSAEFMSGTRPLPRNKPEIAVAHALTAQYFGFKMIYLEGGSGARHSVPEHLITAIAASVEIPLIVGGGIRTPEEAAQKVEAGASFIVTGNILEKQNDINFLRAFASAIHQKGND
ncbi:MAG: geranylgeranylglyceryl/heptaprenylglyceryl phosphate synthase [Calditrichaeota bacterium]|nr:geranylgeranylglyceryl/heptaprenylglyceryl phosphate synthase [Calditrichota bacterium]